MRRRGRLTWTILLALTSCSWFGSGPGFSFKSYSLGRLPPGVRRFAFDGRTDTFWIWGCPGGEPGFPVLEAFRAGAVRLSVTENVVPCSGREIIKPGPALGGLAVDPSGAVWGVAGGRLVRFEPNTRQFTDPPVPYPPGPWSYAGYPDPAPHPASTVVAAPDGAIWLTFDGSSVVRRLEPTTKRWDTYSIAPLEGLIDEGESPPQLLPDGRLALWGADLSHYVRNEMLALIDPRTARTKLVALPAQNFTVRPDGMIAYVDPSGEIVLWSPSSGRSSPTGEHVSQSMHTPWGSGTQQLVTSPRGDLWIFNEEREAVEKFTQANGRWSHHEYRHPYKTKKIFRGSPVHPQTPIAGTIRLIQGFTQMTAADGTVWLLGGASLEHLVV